MNVDWLDSPHPTDSLPRDAQLMSLHIVHPQADMIRAVLAEVNSDATDRTTLIEVEQGGARLWAEVSTPRGVLQF